MFRRKLNYFFKNVFFKKKLSPSNLERQGKLFVGQCKFLENLRQNFVVDCILGVLSFSMLLSLFQASN
jgi:hypothetical protein